MADPPPFKIEFYEDENGRKPALQWITNDLTPRQRQIIGLAMNEILQHEGIDVCDGEWGKPLGDGLHEFRVRHGESEILSRSRSPRTVRRRQAGLLSRLKSVKENVLLRVFFHQDGDTLIIILGGYNKGRFPSKRREQEEIKCARAHLDKWRKRRRQS